MGGIGEIEERVRRMSKKAMSDETSRSEDPKCLLTASRGILSCGKTVYLEKQRSFSS